MFTNQAQAKELLHDDFAFQFMGICSDCTKYNKQTYFDVWINQVIPTRIPNGVELSQSLTRLPIAKVLSIPSEGRPKE